MNVNLLLIPTLVTALLLFVVGQRSVRCCQSRKRQLGVSALWLLLGIPGLLLPLYYLHGFDDAKWFYEFRSFPFSELSAAGVGLFAGALAELAKGTKLISRPFLIALLVLGIAAPHLKSILAPVPASQFTDRWKDDICLQSTSSSCGAASAASIFRSFGESLSEHDIAKACLTSISGTENWYIARAFRQRGFAVQYRIETGFPADLKTPAIAGVRMGDLGHFIAIMDKRDGQYVIGDPLVGRENIFADEIAKKFDFTGFFMEIQKEGVHEVSRGVP